MTKQSIEPSYTLRGIQEMLGISRAVISGFVKAGFVSPARGVRNEYRFGFRDVVLLRTAHSLQAANIPPRKILRSLRRLRTLLPQALPLSGLRITAIGNDIAVREGTQTVAAESGQLLLDFEIAPLEGSVVLLQRKEERAKSASESPVQWFARAEQLEATDRGAAQEAYRRAIALAPDYSDAYLNLGALMYEEGEYAEAVELYDHALLLCPVEPLLHFNRAIALEDLHRPDDSLAAYEKCLKLAPDLADAHWNAARLYDQLGVAQMALQHFSAYRRLLG